MKGKFNMNDNFITRNKLEEYIVNLAIAGDEPSDEASIQELITWIFEHTKQAYNKNFWLNTIGLTYAEIVELGIIEDIESSINEVVEETTNYTRIRLNKKLNEQLSRTTLMNIKKLNEQIESILEDTNNQLSFTKDVQDTYNKVRLYVKGKLQELVKQVEYTDAVDLYYIIFDLLNDLHINIRDHVNMISSNYRKAKKDLEEHPQEIKEIEEHYGKFIRREIEALNQKLGE